MRLLSEDELRRQDEERELRMILRFIDYWNKQISDADPCKTVRDERSSPQQGNCTD